MADFDEVAWASQFTCTQHGNMGATAKLAASVTSRKTCILCEMDNETDQRDAMLIRGPAPPPTREGQER